MSKQLEYQDGYSIYRYREHGNLLVFAMLTSGLPCDSWIVVCCSALRLSSGLACGGYVSAVGSIVLRVHSSTDVNLRFGNRGCGCDVIVVWVEF